jgi:hypothetical protein
MSAWIVQHRHFDSAGQILSILVFSFWIAMQQSRSCRALDDWSLRPSRWYNALAVDLESMPPKIVERFDVDEGRDV